MSALFSKIQLRELTLRNRLVISPMCQYGAIDGVVNHDHLVHYGRFALGGFGLVFVEATAVSKEGRITHGDVGLWSDSQTKGLADIARVLKSNGAAAGIQLAHAGPKASMQRPYHGDGPLNESDFARGDKPWPIVSASALPVADGWLVPEALDADGLARIKNDFVAAAQRALEAGFDTIELHCAHGYLLNSFLSPLTNHRQDEYGGDLAGRMRLPLEIAKTLRALWPANKPVFVRVSAVDNVRVGFGIEDTIAFAKALKALNVDVVDCSTGGIGGTYEHPSGYAYQVPHAARVRAEAHIATMAVGLIVDAHQAEKIVAEGRADLVAIGREALKNPNFAFHAQQELSAATADAPYSDWAPRYGWWLNGRQKGLNKLGVWSVAGDDAVNNPLAPTLSAKVSSRVKEEV